MKWSLFLVLVVCVAGAVGGCAEDYFRSLNVTADLGDSTGDLCKGDCCGRRREDQLRSVLTRRLVAKPVSNLYSIAELIDNTRNTLQEHLTSLTTRSQNTTTQLFSRVYQNHAFRTRASISAFYNDIRSLLHTQPVVLGLGTILPNTQTHNKDLKESSQMFFRNIFPVAYHKVLNLDGKQLTPMYEKCLKDAYDLVQPFGDVPQKLGAVLSKSFEVARELLQALAFGAGVLTLSAQVLSSTGHESCTDSLVRTVACARCRGLDARPCKGYCFNVVRGCIGALVSELDGPWNSYVEGVERIAQGKIDGSIPNLDSRISDAVMHAFTNNATLEKKVREECGPPTTLDIPSSATFTLQPIRRDASGAPPPDTELVQFLAVLTNNNRLFSDISDRICNDHELANPDNNYCWTGDTIGEYTKAVVSSASAADQRYNPEVLRPATNENITNLANRLKHIKQKLTSLSPGSSVPESLMQGDEAGSGSGHVYAYDDDNDDDEVGSGEGSGHHGRIGEGIYGGSQYPEVVTPRTASAISTSLSFGLGLLYLTLLFTTLT